VPNTEAVLTIRGLSTNELRALKLKFYCAVIFLLVNLNVRINLNYFFDGFFWFLLENFSDDAAVLCRFPRVSLFIKSSNHWTWSDYS
jgi:hypothetical protein